jgi:ubiquinone/menaquinone biosynthesis C-methylase UbiE
MVKVHTMETNDKKVEEMVKEWFTKTARGEWRRLKRDPYRKIEFIVTMHFLENYLPTHGLVLDAGGGPGRYTIELAKRGYDVVLLDLAPEMLKLAKKKIRRAGVLRKVNQFVQGSVEDLCMFPDERFDAVLCLGAPLCHLLNAKQREKAVKELVRVAKKDAPIFVSAISRIGLLRSILVRFPHEMQYAKHHWEVGDYVPGLEGEGFTAAHWFMPQELCELLDKQSVEILEMAGLEGLSSHHRKETNRLYKDQEKWKMWIEILLKTCTHPSVVGSSEHFLLVCRKRC